MNKLGTFLAGTVTGVVGLGITAFLVDKYCNDSSSSDWADDNTVTNENAETETCAESSPLLNEEQTEEPSAANAEDKNPAEPFGKIADAIVEALAPTQTAQGSN